MEGYVGWLIAILVLIALIFFMVVSPGFRYLIIGIVVLGGIAIYGWIKYEEKESERRQRTAARIANDHRARHTRRDLFEQFQPFAADAEFEQGKAGGVAAGPRQTHDEAAAN